jgi:hypothetical protein
MTGTKVTITIQDKQNGRYLVIPVLPEVISYDTGAKKVETVTVIDLGDVDILTGVELASLSWASFFPAKYDPAYCATSEIMTPAYWTHMIWAKKLLGTPLQVVCPAMGINQTMYVESMPWEFGEGPDGDVNYSLTLKELKTMSPRQLTVNAPAVPIATQTAVDRPVVPVAQPAAAKTYTVVRGDNLTYIAKKLGIANWRTGLYDPNKGVIGGNPNLIMPGQVLSYA